MTPAQRACLWQELAAASYEFSIKSQERRLFRLARSDQQQSAMLAARARELLFALIRAEPECAK